MFWVILLWAQSAAVQQQVQRGQALFFDSSRGCATCHALKNRGTAIGPDLSVIGRLPAPAIVTGIRSSVTQYVQEVRPKSGPSFPGMPAGEDEKAVRFYDLSKTPPELRTIDRSELGSAVSQDKWKHPPSVSDYTSAQLADIICYLRFAVTGAAQAVNPADVE